MITKYNLFDNNNLNSDGLLIYPTSDGLENFWKWFKDSKIVDSKGRPLVVYHGTRGNFDKFNHDKSMKSTNAPWGLFGFFFTQESELASKFSKGKYWNKNHKYLKGSNVLPVYLSIKNPYYLKAYDGLVICSLESACRKLRDKCISNGYDGIIIGTYKDSYGEDRYDALDGELNTPQYIAFYPEQIKSKTGNNGLFNPNKSSILEEIEIQKLETPQKELNQKDLFKNPPWVPLYNFLKQIFEKDYSDAANQFMYMGTSIFKSCPGGYLHFYKNGLTRRYLLLDKTGEPWKILTKNDDGDWDSGKLNSIMSAVKISFGEAFKEAYNNIEHYSKDACISKSTPENPNPSPYFISYNDDYKRNLFKKLTDAGYTVLGINTSDTGEDIKMKLKG